MSVSDKARAEVKKRSGGYCELFHDHPVQGNQIVHSTHQGMGGMPEDAPCNQADVLLFGCDDCHRKLHGPGMPWEIAEIDLDERILEIVDSEGRKVGHDRIFFYLWPEWKIAERRYTTLSKAARRLRMAQWIVARELDWFKGDGHKGKELWRVVEEANSIWSFGALLGFTASQLKRYARIGKWGVESNLRRLLSGLDLDVMDALRKASESDLIDLMGIAQHGKPSDFYEELDLRKNKDKKKREFWIASGPIRPERAEKKEDIALKPGEKLLRTLLIGGEDVKEEE